MKFSCPTKCGQPTPGEPIPSRYQVTGTRHRQNLPTENMPPLKHNNNQQLKK